MMFKRASGSSELGKKGGYLVALSSGDRLLFEGCLELAVLTGTVEVHGFLLTSSHPPLPLFSPLNSPHLPILPSPSDAEEEQMGAGFAGRGRGLGAEDVEWLNSLAADSVIAVCMVWNLDSLLVTSLQSVPNSGLLPSKLDGRMATATFRLLKGDVAPTPKFINFPEDFHTQLNKVLEYRGPVVLVCGGMNSGKSTLGRFLVNKFLNRCDKVGFLECDVGQPEFTVPMVTALHVLTHPVFGPAHFSHRRPYKAYFFGELSPARKPRYYVHLINQLFSLFMSGIRGDGEVPLIINTCGWTKYLGVALLMDIIRLTSPSHIVRMVPDKRRVFNVVTDLLPFTPHTLTSTPGILTPSSSPVPVPWSTEEHWYSEHITGLSAPEPTPVQWNVYRTKKRGCSETTPDRSGDAKPGTKRYHRETKQTTETPPRGNHWGTKQTTETTLRETTRDDDTTEESETDSSTEELVSDSDSDNRQDKVTEVTEVARATPSSAVGGVRRHRRRAQGHRSKIARTGLRCLISEPKYENGTPLAMNASSDHWEEVEMQLIGRWVKVLNHQIMVQRVGGVNGLSNKKRSSLSRRLSLVAHFAPLIGGCGDHTHFLDSAPVLEVSWNDVAIHVLHQQVPRSTVVNAMMGCIVALCRVDPCEVVEEGLVGGGSVRFLRSHTPDIEFIAMGVLCGSSSEKQLFYVTTPLITDRDVAMDTVNVLVMGEVSSLYGFSGQKTTPTSFRHIDIGQFVWRKLT
ncbi:Polynucleotide 5'-hydroxyl-kinase NOL9 [Geodia barretti]|uniref:Polynucleotide 5'-hydroxyl-kinase NOL9 n=1 Tax=Geodia barretti TaxID=519541 RepID=A0AA35RCI9_GEOBA|nr:Polynucleotide 5'-hydroxyl-kinase NOL9 [Geodia barretti]